MKRTTLIISFCLITGIVCSQPGIQTDTLARLYLEGEYAASKSMIAEVLKNGMETKDAWYFYGKTHEALFNFDSARICYENALKFDSSDLKVLNSLASVYVNRRNLKKAGEVYRLILSINPLQTEAKINLANLLIRMDQDRQAKEIFDQLIATDTSNSYFLNQLATCYYNLNLNDSAIFWYEKSLQLNPEDYLTIIRLSNLYIRHGNIENGLSITGRYLEYDSLNLQVLKLNAYIHFLSGNYDKAIDRYMKSCAYGDSSFAAMKYLGLSYFQKEDMYLAATWLDKAYRLDTTDMETCLYLGISTGWTMDKMKGIKYLEKVLGMIFPSDDLVVRVYREIADLYVAWSKPDLAIPYYLKVLEYNTDNRMVLFKLGNLYENIDKEKALDWYNDFMKTRDPDAHPVTTSREGFMVVSYYDIAEEKIIELKKELFFEGKLQKE
jgi:tetratricopeptide (TPR) repeat protein